MSASFQRPGILRQAIRYVLVGIIVVGIDYFVFWCVAGNQAPPEFSNVLAKVCAGFVGYWLHRKFTFHWHQKHNRSVQLLGYFVLASLNAALSSILMSFFIRQLEFPPIYAKIFADTLSIIFAFFGSRNFVYAPLNR